MYHSSPGTAAAMVEATTAGMATAHINRALFIVRTPEYLVVTMPYSHVAVAQRSVRRHHTRLRTPMNSQSSRCGKNAASVAGRKGHRKGEAEKEKTQHLSECWVCWLPPGRQKERYKTNSSERGCCYAAAASPM